MANKSFLILKLHLLKKMEIMKQDEPGSNISPGPAGSNSGLNTSKSPPPESKLIVPEGAQTETRGNAVTRWSQSHDSLSDDVEQEDFLSSRLSVRKSRSIDCQNNLETMASVKLKGDPNVLQSDALRAIMLRLRGSFSGDCILFQILRE